jgi:hypothetical protein
MLRDAYDYFRRAPVDGRLLRIVPWRNDPKVQQREGF